MKGIWLPLLLANLFRVAVAAQAAEFWLGSVQYTPPIVMSHGPEGGPWPTNGWKFATMGSSTNGFAEVAFRIENVEIFMDKESTNEVRSILDLKRFVDHTLKKHGVTNYQCGLTEVDNRQAIVCTTVTNNVIDPYRPPCWSCSLNSFWKTNSRWQKSALFEVMVTAENPKTFSLLTNSLKTLKLNPEKLR
jgi:hypothetical protein